MKKVGRIVSLLSAAAMMLSSAGLTAFAQQESGSKENTVSSAVAAMSTEQKLEQMMMISLRKWTDSGTGGLSDVTSLNDAQRKLIQDHNFSGVCLFSENLKQTEQIAALTNEIQQYLPLVVNLCYALAGIFAVVGAVSVYIAMNNEEQDVKKKIMMTIGACIFMVAAANALPLFFGQTVGGANP